MYTEENKSLTPETPEVVKSDLSNPELEHFQASLKGLKQELSRVRGLERTEILNKLQEIESIGHHFEQWMKEPSVSNGNGGNGSNTYSLQEREQLLNLAHRIQEGQDFQSVLELACEETLKISEGQRCLIYQFQGTETGKVLAEKVERGWTPARGETLPATFFGRDMAQDYLQEGIVSISSSNAYGSVCDLRATPYQQQLLDRYQVQSSLALIIRIDGQPWGLLVVHHCQSAQPFPDQTVNILYQVSTELALQLASFDYQEQVKQERSREQTKVAIISRIRQSQDLDSIFETATQEIRRALGCDRVGIYRFNEDWSGGFVAEAVTTGWTPVVDSDDPAGDVKNDCSLRMLGGERRARESEDTYLRDTQGGGYTQGKKYSVVNDIYEMGFPRCYLNQLEKYECRAYINVPIFQGEKLWGLMAAYQNSGPRQWTEAEKDLLVEISEPLGVALNQAEYIEQLEKQAQREAAQTQQERTKATIISRIRQSQDLDTIFQVTTQELRKVVNSDRAVVYQFNPDWSGQVVAESVTGGWVSLLVEQTNDEVLSGDRTSNDRCTLRKWSSGDITERDTYLQENQGGKYKDGKRYTAIDDIYAANFPTCYIQSLEKYQARAYIIVPIFQGSQIWGLLGIYQNSGPRIWQEDEIDLLVQVGDQLAVALQQAEFVEQLKEKNDQLAQGVEREKTVSKVVDRIRRTPEVNAVFNNTTQEIRNVLGADRVALYKFYDDWSGEFVAESVAAGWKHLVGTEEAKVKDTYLKDNEGGRYALGQNHVVADIYKEGFDECHVELLETFQCRAYILVPVFQDEVLWGILGVYQNGGPRIWQDSEVQLTRQVGTQFGVALKQAQYLEQIRKQSEALAESAEREQAASKIVDRIRRTQEVKAVFDNTTQEVLNVLKAERVALYQFHEDWSGEFVAESVAAGWKRLVGTDEARVKDTYLKENQGGRYALGQSHVVPDIYEEGFDQCHVELLETFQCRAYILVPVFQDEVLWGILGVYQNSAPRIWQDSEVQLTRQVATQFGVALKQAEYLEQIRQQTDKLAEAAEREQAVSKVVDKIRRSQDVKTIFDTATQEVRLLLKADRVGLYQFHEDWSGEFVAESVATGWQPLVGTENAKVKDTYLQENKGGRYSRGESHVVPDIYEEGFDSCHLELLETFQCRSYILVPVFQDDVLWGILGVYQNGEARQWQQQEVKLLQQIGVQLGIALKQAEFLEQIRQQSEQLAQAAQRERQAKELLQRRAIELLTAVRPALDGNLTVRAPVTDDELGTIADAYNNTLKGLRQIVVQVQQAVEKVAQTSTESDQAINQLSKQATQQSYALGGALDQVESMTHATQDVANNAQAINQAVQKSNATVSSGDAAMNRTVDGIQGIRDAVSETSRNIRQLGESSQKISRVVNLISDFSKQTQLLSLNASIEATRAGEYGRGFAVVADEVRSLARQSADATKEIEDLVAEIRNQTTEAIKVTERAIAQVSAGTNLVQEAKEELNAIAAATAEISKLVAGITEASQGQLQQSQSVTQTMKEVAEIANATSEQSNALSASFKEALDTAQQLQAAVDKFTI